MAGFVSESSTGYCSHCGGLLARGDDYCVTCGSPIGRPMVQHQSLPPFAPVSSASTDVPQDVPQEIRHWNWAAFFFNWIWALARGLYAWAIAGIAIIVLVGPLWFLFPLFIIASWALCIFLGVKGNELDWKRGHYQSVAEFRQSHRRWTVAGKIFLVVFVVLLSLSVAALVLLGSQSLTTFLVPF